MPRFDVSSPASPGWRTRVVVEPGCLVGAARSLARTYRAARCVVVSDARVARLYGRPFARRLERHGARTLLLTFPAGERSKSRETKARLEDRLVAAGVGRDAVVIAVGGGVTGDLAGFLAATWQRGVPVVQIPTTTLAMLDAALGGKTGVDLPQAKNLVGAFHQPAWLFADVRVLRTLPPRAYLSGLAEAVKIAVALDAELFSLIESSARRLLLREERALTRLVGRCLARKGDVVARDDREAGPRAALNFGHTVAHALETATGYRIAHGEAVAIGVAVESRAAERRGLMPRSDADRIERLLSALDLPTKPPRGLDRSRLRPAMQRDKKTRGGVVRCALPRRIGAMPRTGDPSVAVDPSRELLPLLTRH